MRGPEYRLHVGARPMRRDLTKGVRAADHHSLAAFATKRQATRWLGRKIDDWGIFPRRKACLDAGKASRFLADGRYMQAAYVSNARRWARRAEARPAGWVASRLPRPMISDAAGAFCFDGLLHDAIASAICAPCFTRPFVSPQMKIAMGGAADASHRGGKRGRRWGLLACLRLARRRRRPATASSMIFGIEAILRKMMLPDKIVKMPLIITRERDAISHFIISYQAIIVSEKSPRDYFAPLFPPPISYAAAAYRISYDWLARRRASLFLLQRLCDLYAQLRLPRPIL